MGQSPLDKAVLAALERDPRINLHRSAIAVTSVGDAVTVEGEVNEIAEKRRAIWVASQVPGVANVIDRLCVVSADPMGDGEIREHVVGALRNEPALAEGTIHAMTQQGYDQLKREGIDSIAIYGGTIYVCVENGVVHLAGRVGSLSHRLLAAELAWWVPGSRDVVNHLLVEPPREDTDDELAEVVRLILEKDRLVDAGGITVRAENHTIRLAGNVPVKEQRTLAEHDAWYVEGVHDVLNELNTP